jgi:hypothetical protein
LPACEERPGMSVFQPYTHKQTKSDSVYS